MPPRVVTAPETTRSDETDASPPTEIGEGSLIEFTHWGGVRKGSGRITQPEAAEIVAINMDLKSDDSYEMSLIPNGAGTKPVAKFGGTWEIRDGKTINFTTKIGPNNPWTGKGAIHFMDRTNPYRWEFKGKDARGKAVSWEFQAQE
jgi:hypothetical protein